MPKAGAGKQRCHVCDCHTRGVAAWHWRGAYGSLLRVMIATVSESAWMSTSLATDSVGIANRLRTRYG